MSVSCKRMDALLTKHQDVMLEKLENDKGVTSTGLQQEMSLVRHSDTRWGSHLKTILRIYQIWEIVLEVLEIVRKDACQLSSHGGAFGLIQKMESFEFVFILHLLIDLLSIISELSLVLQRKDQDIVGAMDLLVDMKIRLQDMRDNGWEPLFQRVKSFCESNEIHMPNMEELILVRALDPPLDFVPNARTTDHGPGRVAAWPSVSTQRLAVATLINLELLWHL